MGSEHPAWPRREVDESLRYRFGAVDQVDDLLPCERTAGVIVGFETVRLQTPEYTCEVVDFR